MYSPLKTVALMLAASCVSSIAFAERFPIPANNQSLIGETQVITTQEGDNVVSIAKRYNVSFNTLKSANPDLDMKRAFLTGTSIAIPNQYLIPDVKRDGIIINLPEMRMYYFPRNGQEVETYPIGIGKIGNTIPITNTAIVRKAENPTWIPTENIRKFNLEQGIVLPKVMGAGPDNPLGRYAIYTRLSTYLIHSTIFPESIGKRASFGCIRMFEGDIEHFFPSIEKDIPVYILNMPTKLAIEDDVLYMEAHQPLEEHRSAHDASLPAVVHRITEITKDQPYLIDWQLIADLSLMKDSMPHEVGFKVQSGS